jgi:hypothetical protein
LPQLHGAVIRKEQTHRHQGASKQPVGIERSAFCAGGGLLAQPPLATLTCSRILWCTAQPTLSPANHLLSCCLLLVTVQSGLIPTPQPTGPTPLCQMPCYPSAPYSQQTRL